MTTLELIQSQLKTAGKILQEAKTLLENKTWHLVVRRCQESVELYLKAMLRLSGVEVPHLHDVGSLFKKYPDRFENFPIDKIVSISRRLREEREISFYGDELTESPAEILYSQEDADEAIGAALFIESTVLQKVQQMKNSSN